MATPRHCNIIAGQLARALDKAKTEGSQFQPSQRMGMQDDGGNWRLPDGGKASEFGPAIVPLQKKEWLSVTGYITNSGPAGNKFASISERFREARDVWTGQEYKKLQPFFKGLSAQEHRNAIEVLEKRKLDVDANGAYLYMPGSHKNLHPVNQRVARAVSAFEEYRQMAEQRAAREINGYKPQTLRVAEMYNTNTLKKDKFGQATRQGLAERYARQNGRTAPNANDLTTAEAAYDHYTNGGQFVHLSSHVRRGEYLDIGESRILDLDKISQLYISQHQTMLQEKRFWGARTNLHETPELARQLVSQFAKENEGKQIAKVVMSALYNDTFGIHPSDPIMHSRLLEGLGQLQALKLTFSTLKHGSRAFNAWMKTDLSSVAKSLHALLTNSNELFDMPTKEAAGSFASVVSNTLYESTLFQGGNPISWAGEKILKYNGFTPVDKGARMLTGTAGAFYAQKQAERFARTGSQKAARILREFGIDPDLAKAQNGKLSLEQKLLSGQRLLNASDGRGRASDLPFFTANHPDMWRAILTFRSFPLNQVRLMWDMAYQNPIRMLTFGLGLMPAMGYGLKGFEDFILEDIAGIPRQKYRDKQDGVASYLEAMSMGTSFGYLSELASVVYMSGADTINYRHFLLPPIMSTIEDALTVGGHIAHGKYRDIERDVLREFGGLGSAFTRVIF